MSQANPSDKMLRTGIIGAVLAAICCFTPLLVIVIAAVGLSAITGWLDYALFPMLFVCLGLVAQALFLRGKTGGPSPKMIIIASVVALSVLIVWLEFRFALRISVAATLAVVAYGFYLRRAGSKHAA
ncbi:MAG: mercury resistance system transport protein MerF [Alphaproteobacteria bacterium]